MWLVPPWEQHSFKLLWQAGNSSSVTHLYYLVYVSVFLSQPSLPSKPDVWCLHSLPLSSSRWFLAVLDSMMCVLLSSWSFPCPDMVLSVSVWAVCVCCSLSASQWRRWERWRKTNPSRSNGQYRTVARSPPTPPPTPASPPCSLPPLPFPSVSSSFISFVNKTHLAESSLSWLRGEGCWNIPLVIHCVWQQQQNSQIVLHSLDQTCLLSICTHTCTHTYAYCPAQNRQKNLK